MSEFNDVVMRLPTGRWEYWPVLQIVEFYPKGKKTATVTLHIPQKYNTGQSAALEFVFAYEIKRVSKNIRNYTGIPKP